LTTETTRYFNAIKYLTARLSDFMALQPAQDSDVEISVDAKLDTYTRSAAYQIGVTQYHATEDTALFILDLAQRIHPSDTIVDAGCASGFAGLSLAQFGRGRVIFHDYPGLGLSFLDWFIKNEPLEQARVVAYTEPIEQHDWCLACDVLEHTGNHLAALKWFATLGKKVALCYPLSIGFSPPYVNVIDEWVDDEMIQAAIARRHTILDTAIRDGRRCTIYEV
jgi:hypothetical protein